MSTIVILLSLALLSTIVLAMFKLSRQAWVIESLKAREQVQAEDNGERYTAIGLISKERHRQRTKGYTAAFDDMHHQNDGYLLRQALFRLNRDTGGVDILVQAAACIAAEIDVRLRLSRSRNSIRAGVQPMEKVAAAKDMTDDVNMNDSMGGVMSGKIIDSDELVDNVVDMQEFRHHGDQSVGESNAAIYGVDYSVIEIDDSYVTHPEAVATLGETRPAHTPPFPLEHNKHGGTTGYMLEGRHVSKEVFEAFMAGDRSVR